MSLNTTSLPADTNDLFKLNINRDELYNRYASGITITYSSLDASQTTIFDAYKSQFGISNVSLDGVLVSDTNWAADIDTAMQAAGEIINLNFTPASVAASDLRWTGVSDAGNSGILGMSYLTPNWDMDNNDGDNNFFTGDADAGILIYTNNGWHTPDSETGGSNERVLTMLHELGHFLGLSHPHDEDPSDAPFAELNDNKYDVMSYLNSDNDRRSPNFGGFVNYTPINMASLQYLYNTNTNNTTATTYTLTDAGSTALDINGADGNVSIGRAFYSIWDTNGIDEIAYGGANRSILNLNEATLDRNTNDADLLETLARVRGTDFYADLFADYKLEITDSKYYAGGFFSQILTPDSGKYIDDVGGYTIAKGAEIENASGGSGNDLIIGNALANILNGNGGNDTIFDGNGDDFVYGGAGDDLFYVGRGDDTFSGSTGSDTADLYTPYTRFQITDNGSGNYTVQDVIDGDYGTNTFSSVEFFTFAGVTFDLADLPTGANEFEREYNDLLNNDLLIDFGLSGLSGYDFG